MSKKKFKTILCGCITPFVFFLTSCGSLQISQGSGTRILTAEIKRQQKRHSHRQGT